MFATASPVRPSVKVDRTAPTSNVLAIPVVHATLCFDILSYMVAVSDRLRYIDSSSLG